MGYLLMQMSSHLKVHYYELDVGSLGGDLKISNDERMLDCFKISKQIPVMLCAGIDSSKGTFSAALFSSFSSVGTNDNVVMKIMKFDKVKV